MELFTRLPFLLRRTIEGHMNGLQDRAAPAEPSQYFSHLFRTQKLKMFKSSMASRLAPALQLPNLKDEFLLHPLHCQHSLGSEEVDSSPGQPRSSCKRRS